MSEPQCKRCNHKVAHRPDCTSFTNAGAKCECPDNVMPSSVTWARLMERDLVRAGTTVRR